MTRVRVFIDYQNVYHRARGTFDLEHDAPYVGNVRPVRLGHLVTTMGRSVDSNRKLTGVQVYRGEPTYKSHPKVQAAFQRQVETWRSNNAASGLLTVKTRPLRYEPTAWDHTGRVTQWGSAQEKGIDVMLALDLALGAKANEFDVAVVVSGDTDLIPAIEAAQEAGARVENAVWWPEDDSGRPIRLSSRPIWCHRLYRREFESVRDDTDFAAATE